MSRDRQHRFRWETTRALDVAIRTTCAPVPEMMLAENDRPRAFPNRRPEVHNYPLGVTSTPVFECVLTATDLIGPPIRTKSRSPNMRGSTLPLTVRAHDPGIVRKRFGLCFPLLATDPLPPNPRTSRVFARRAADVLNVSVHRSTRSGGSSGEPDHCGSRQGLHPGSGGR